jgi:cyanophycin synthetase
MTRVDGWVVLNADDPLVAAVGRRVRGRVAYFSLDGLTPRVRRHIRRGGRAYVVLDGSLIELEDGAARELAPVREIPLTIGGLARHNVANALAASGAARALGATVDDVGDGLRDFRPTADFSPGRLNLFRLGSSVVIVDFAHNEAGIAAILDVAEGIAAGAAGRTSPVTAIVGTAGDRPDDTLRGIGRIAARRAQRVAIKETQAYLRGRTRGHVVGEFLAGIEEGGVPRSDVPVYESETAALRGELSRPNGRPDGPRVVVLMCHEERPAVFELLASLGARPIDVATELTELIPRLQDRPRRG